MNHDKYTNWRKSRHSNSSGACVEIASQDHTVGVRDSKQHGNGPVLEFALAEWRAFLTRARGGEFDL